MSQNNLSSLPFGRFGNFVFSAAVGGGAKLGWYVGGLWGGDDISWLGAGIGVGLIGGSGYYLHSTYHPAVGARGRAIRFVEYGMILGAFGYITARWLGPAGPFIVLPVLMILVVCIVRLYRLVAGMARAVVEWLGLNEQPIV
jgi:hypothetical protein